MTYRGVTSSSAPDASPLLEIVVPARNEELRIGRMLDELAIACKNLATIAVSSSVVVVDNASMDDTAAAALARATDDMPVRIVDCPVRGKGAAVRAGVATTSAPLVAYLDADGATDPIALLDAVDAVRSGVAIALGSRAHRDSVVEARTNPVRSVGAATFRRLTRTLVPDVVDTQCGFKVAAGDILRTLCTELEDTGFAFDVELLARASRAGLSMREIPVHWSDVPGSTFSPVRHGAGSFWQLARIAWALHDAPVTRNVVSARPVRG